MAELANCARCDAVFVKNIRDICYECYKAEEAAFDKVYRFLSERKNREATMMEIVDATRVEEGLIIKFLKQNRLRQSQFPNLTYPCERCGIGIVRGRVCHSCSQEIKEDLERHEAQQENRDRREKEQKKASIYYSVDTSRK